MPHACVILHVTSYRGVLRQSVVTCVEGIVVENEHYSAHPLFRIVVSIIIGATFN